MTLPCAAGVGTSQKVVESGRDQGLRVQVLFDAAGHAGAGSVLRRAYDIAAACHDGQLRFSGDSYITHPVEVALICQDLGMGPLSSAPPCCMTCSTRPIPPASSAATSAARSPASSRKSPGWTGLISGLPPRPKTRCRPFTIRES
jgi:hypothetical protein